MINMRVVLSFTRKWLVIDETGLIIDTYDNAYDAYDFLSTYYGE